MAEHASRSEIVAHVDLARVSKNAQAVARRVGPAEVWAVVKADAYGLGIGPAAEALSPHVAGFCVFDLVEAIDGQLWQRTGKPIVALGPPGALDAEAYKQHHVRPAVSTVEQARALRAARPLLCVDTGMRRFACPAAQVGDVLRAGQIDEAFTHAVRLDQVQQLRRAAKEFPVRRLHAAATALLDEPAAWLDAVRPGLALYAGALRVTAPLIEAGRSDGPVGYTGFVPPDGCHGVIRGGYFDGLRPGGPCIVNGVRRRIAEVGMQTSYVELGPRDRAGDEVVLLGDGLDERTLADAWGCPPQQVIVRLSLAGKRTYARGH